MSKTCKTCNLEKKLQMFNKDKRIKDGRRNNCKECSCIKRRKLYNNNLEENRKKGREKKREQRKNNTKMIRTDCYYNYKNNAKKRGYTFELTKEQVIKLTENLKCFFCNQEYKRLGIDRIRNDEGYKLGNVVSCCKMCNRMKSNFDFNSFIKKCNQIAKHLKGENDI